MHIRRRPNVIGRRLSITPAGVCLGVCWARTAEQFRCSSVIDMFPSNVYLQRHFLELQNNGGEM